MDFFGAQEAARARSRRLTVLFAAAVLGIILTVYAVVQLAMFGYLRADAGFFRPGLFAAVAGGTLLLVASGSLYRIRQLRQGGPAVAAMMGGRRVTSNTTDLDERRLVNVVEEMAVASGTPVPAVYVLDAEAGMNAFAAGYTIHDAAVAVTAGTLRALSRDELQGVIAHEFSHILNGDMRTNIRLIGLLHGILLLAVVGRGLLQGGGRRSSGRKGGQAALIGVSLLLVGYVGVFFGKLIRAAISREREYLADAAAVQFTRNPDGVSGALKKIGIHSAGSRVHDPHAEEVSHLFFAHGLRSHWLGFMSTHPPLEDRIRRIDPRWDGLLVPPVPEPGATGHRGAAGAAAGGVASMAGHAGRHLQAGISAAVSGTPGDPAGDATAAALIGSIGSLSADRLSRASALLEGLPAELREAAHDPEGARALVLALLLGSAEHPAWPDAAELGAAREAAGPRLSGRLDSLLPLVQRAGAEARLPLLDLALPTLQALPATEARDFRAAVLRTVRADGGVRMFEYTLVHVLARQLGERPAVHPGRAIHSLKPVRGDVEVVLSGLARAGAPDEPRARAALAAAVERLPPIIGELHLLDDRETSLPAVDRALERIGRTSFGIRRRLLDACAHCVAHDRRLQPAETELLRAIAEALNCPMPLPSLSPDARPASATAPDLVIPVT